MKIKPQTLAVAIQCISAVTKILDERLGNEQSKDATELEQLLVGFDSAGLDLKAAYEASEAQYSGLPAYEDLLAWSL